MSFSAFIYKDKFEDYRMGNTAPSAHRVSPISLLSGDKIGSIGLSIYISVNARKTRAHDMDFSRGVDRAIYLFVCFFHAGLKTFHFYIKRRHYGENKPDIARKKPSTIRTLLETPLCANWEKSSLSWT